MDEYLWMGLEASRDLVTLAEAGEWEEGDGLRIGLLAHHVVFTVKTPNRDCEITIPIIDLLQAIGDHTKRHGN
jgi:hypothetical protein